ncbi:MAG TPA: hypothetical protein VGV18_11550, partial [Verrucomicrobiae bacterium]|nr:hypothetical protein [Verrucomicrobiae bacterium]
MPLLSARRAVVSLCLGLFLGSSAALCAQTNYYAADGTEYPVIGSLPGDQMYPALALNANGGFVVWQDNITDGSGWGISAMQLNRTLSGSGDAFRVNIQGVNNQENPHVSLLKNGGACFVWQGGSEGVSQHIYARFLWPVTNASGTTNYVWTNPTSTNDIAVDSTTNGLQTAPAVTTLTNGDVLVVWSSFNRASPTSMMDVYGQLLTTNGTRIGTNFLINQFTPYNQRNPAVAALPNGGFVVAWVSEQERIVGQTNSADLPADSMLLPSVDVYERLYTISGSNAVPATGEILVNQDNNPCAHPAIATALDGSYMVTWCAKDMVNPANGWDIYERSFTNSIGGPIALVNTHTYGDQFDPRVAVIGGDYLIVWTSMGQDGSDEGVYGQFVHKGNSPVGNEFLVNTTTLGSQMQPAVASDGQEQFLAIWTSFTFGPNGFDLFAQRYENAAAVLEPMGAPFVWAPFVISNGVYQPQLVVTWPPVQGLAVSNYLVFVDGSDSPIATVTGNEWTMTAANGLSTNSTHSFATEYVTSQGFASPISPSASGATWSGLNWDGIPYEWMAEFFGGYYNGAYHTSFWPAAHSPVAPGGPTLLQVFITGGNPFNSSTWLQTSWTRAYNGMYLNWNTQPGMTYQVQKTTDFKTWSNYGSPRFEAGTNDSIFMGNSGGG